MKIEIKEKVATVKKLVKEIRNDASLNEDDKETVLSELVESVSREYLQWLQEA